MFSDTPLHDWASDWADAFRYMCLAVNLLFPVDVETTADRIARGSVLLMKDFHLEGMHEDAAHQRGSRRIA